MYEYAPFDTVRSISCLVCDCFQTTIPKSASQAPGETLLPGPHIVRAERSLPVMSRGMRMLRDSLSAQGLHVHMWRDLPNLLAPGSPLWVPKSESKFPAPSPKMQTEPQGYRDIVATAHVLPNAPWHPTNARLRAIGEVVQQVGYANWQNFGLLFRQHGLSEEEASHLVNAGLEEASKNEVRKVMLYHTIHATKIQGS